MPDPLHAPPLPRVLYVTHRVPFPPDKGDRIRNYHVLKQLAGRARVWLVALADEPVAFETRAELNRLCERVELVPVGGAGRYPRTLLAALFGQSLSAGMHRSGLAIRVVEKWAVEASFAAAIVSAGALANYLQLPGLRNARKVVDLVDVDSQKWFDFATTARGPKRWLYQFEGRRTQKLEVSLPGRVDAITIVARHEADLFDAVTFSGAATVATNGVDLEFFQPHPGVTSKLACAFVGAMDYLPNVDASIWFAQQVWPTVRERFPTAEFRIVGRKPTAAVQKLAEIPGVVVVGQVPDVRPYVADVAAAVVPMRLSRGLQNKVLEALAMGLPVIASPPALAALLAKSGEDVLSATTPAEWIDAVDRLFRDAELRTRLGQAGRRFVETHHHWDRCLEPLLAAVLPAPGSA